MNIVFFTGAGISEESGVPTFRDKEDSLWNKYDPNIVASTYGLENHFEEVLEFHKEARRLINICNPNYCHKVIAELEKEHTITVLTTNMDNLHERAGSSNIIHLHGSIFEVCDLNRKNPYISNIDIKVGDLHPQTGLQLRYNTVLFGEDLLVDCFNLFRRTVRQVDKLVVVGSSLSVYPASHITLYNDNIIYLGKQRIENKGWKVIQKSACEGINEVLNLIES
jgi:NAD-dependent deacetylase